MASPSEMSKPRNCCIFQFLGNENTDFSNFWGLQSKFSFSLCLTLFICSKFLLVINVLPRPLQIREFKGHKISFGPIISRQGPSKPPIWPLQIRVRKKPNVKNLIEVRGVLETS